MDNNDSNIKSQQTGGLKLMTVFIVVLALHVLVIGGYSAYMLLGGGSTDADLTALDKTHKVLKAADGSAIADGAVTDANPGEKSAPSAATSTSPVEVVSIPANPPAPDITAPSEVVTPAPGPAPVLTPVPASTAITHTPKLTTPTPPAEVVDEGSQTPSGPISLQLAPPPEPAPVLSTPVASGPVHMPSATSTPAAPKIERAHEAIYVVKITDSYKKIAHTHHVTVAQLKEANHIKGDVLHTGQKLVIPSTKTLVTTTASTTATTAALESTSTGPILNESSTTNLAAAPSSTTTTASQHHLYTVVKGDTLIKIAHKFKTTSTAIMAENNITDPAKLAIGKKLKIPSRESRSVGNNVPSTTQPRQVQVKENAPSPQLANFAP